MRYLSYIAAQGPTWGVSSDGAVHDLGPSGANLAPTLAAAIAGGALASVDEHTVNSQPAVPEEQVSFLPVIPDPRKVLCIGVNYSAHRDETGREEISVPTVFFRFPDSQIGHRQPAVYPAVSEQFDYEGELAVVIGKPAWRVSAADAYAHVGGYAPYVDFTARDWQRAASQWGPGKTFPGTGAFGPYLTTADAVGDVTRLHLQTRVNGEVRQDADVSDLIFDIPALIEHVTAFTPLAPGDVIVTGTPSGVGMFSDPPRLLEPGHVVEVQITGPGDFTLGTLTNTVVAEQ